MWDYKGWMEVTHMDTVSTGICRYCQRSTMSSSTVCISCYHRYWRWCPVCMQIRRDGSTSRRSKYNTGERIGVCIQCHGTRGHLLSVADADEYDRSTGYTRT
jgi:hypothetical protein